MATATTATTTDRWRWLLLASALVAVAPLWTAKYLPFLDLPEHVAAIATLRHWNDPSWGDGATYALTLGRTPYLAYHLAGAALAFPLGPELANRVLLSAAGIALPYSVRALLRAYETDERLALLACPLFWSRPLVIGFLPYVAALPVLCFALALVVRDRRQTRRAHGAIALAAAAVLLFFLHVAAVVVLGVVVSALWAIPYPKRSLRGFLRAAAPLLPSAACAAIWAVRADRLVERVTYGPSRSKLGELFAGWSHDIWASHVDEVVGIGFWGIVLWLGVQRRSDEPGGAWAVLARLAPFAGVLLLFFVLPYRVGAGAMLNVRLAVLLALFVLLVPRPDPGPRSDVALVCGALLTLVTAIDATAQIRRAQRELGDLDAVLAEIRPKARLLTLLFDRSSEITHGSSFVHAAAYHRLRGGGVASPSFSELAHWPIQYRPEARPPTKRVLFWDFKPCLFRNTVDGPYYDFILARGLDPFAHDPPGPAWRRLAVIDGWRLYEREPGPPRRAGEPDPGPCAP